MSDDNKQTLKRIEHWICAFRNPMRRKQVKCANSLYWNANKVLNSDPLQYQHSYKVAEALLKREPVDFMRGGKVQVHLLAEAIFAYSLDLSVVRTKDVIGSAEALFQANLNSTRDNDTAEDRIRKQELWGNKADPEIRAKMTGGRANDIQVGGEHYRKQKIQHWDYVIANEIPYLEAQIIKYVSRWRNKNGMQDLEKALHFLQKLIEVESCTDVQCANQSDCQSAAARSAEQECSSSCQPERTSTSD